VFKRWHDILSRDGEKLHKFERIVNEYVSIIRLDPGLPLELLGKSWIGYEAFNIFKEIRGILLTA
jgi:DNA-binding transcriptional regulator PaaX